MCWLSSIKDAVFKRGHFHQASFGNDVELSFLFNDAMSLVLVKLFVLKWLQKRLRFLRADQLHFFCRLEFFVFRGSSHARKKEVFRVAAPRKTKRTTVIPKLSLPLFELYKRGFWWWGIECTSDHLALSSGTHQICLRNSPVSSAFRRFDQLLDRIRFWSDVSSIRN